MQSDRRLVYICPEFPGFARFGGIGAGMRIESEWFASQGCDVHVICPTSEYPAGRFRQNRVTVHVINPSPLRKIRAFTDRIRTAHLAGRLSTRDSSVLICADFTGPLWVKPSRIPLLVQLHGSAMLLAGYYGPACAGRLSYFERRTVEMADALQAVSGFVARTTAALANLRGKPLGIVPLSTDPARFQSPAQPANPQEILFVGGKLSELKGIFTLAAAMCDVFREFDSVRLMMVARDSAISGRSGKAMFLERIPAEFHSRIAFRERASQGEVRSLMEQCGMLVVPSFVETLSVVAIEAMASGRPVIASNRGGLPEVVRDGVTGLLADPDNPPEFTQAISALLRNPELAATLGAAGRRVARAEYHPEAVFRRVRKLHDQLLSSVPRAKPALTLAGR
ncbi:MAG: glycosyltransferase family 4 protein [Candidatus Solibacter sp.]|jgi:glycosyltransferase involved in cell wall biosynthesis